MIFFSASSVLAFLDSLVTAVRHVFLAVRLLANQVYLPQQWKIDVEGKMKRKPH